MPLEATQQRKRSVLVCRLMSPRKHTEARFVVTHEGMDLLGSFLEGEVAAQVI